MNVTQKQIADHIGVSQSLVGRALKAESSVADATRLRVQQAAKELGYSPNSNLAARALRARRSGFPSRTNTICVLMGDLYEGVPLRDVPFYKPIFRGFKAEAERRELDISFSTLQNDRIPRLLTEGGFDAAICLYSTLNFSSSHLRALPCPVLRVGDGSADDWALRPDDHRGIYLATQHLIQLGHRDIAYLGEFRGSATQDISYKCRIEGYLDALRNNDIPIRDTLVEAHIGAPDHESGAAGIARILDRNPGVTAVVCFNDTSALGAMAELQRRGISVPDEISITGFDDVWEAYGDDPALTTVYFDRFEMGRRAVEQICVAIDKGVSSSYDHAGHQLLPVALIQRGSSAAPRA